MGEPKKRYWWWSRYFIFNRLAMTPLGLMRLDEWSQLEKGLKLK